VGLLQYSGWTEFHSHNFQSSERKTGTRRSAMLAKAPKRIQLQKGSVSLFWMGDAMRNSTWSLERSTVAAELKRFIAEKCAQVREEIRAPEHEMGPESKSLFTAAESGDWRGVFDSLAAMHKAAREGQNGSSRSRSRAVYPVEWAVVNEIGAALQEFAAGEEKYAIAFARDIIASIPPGSIYFGGTDSGRFLVTALSNSHIKADPFFTITQNALADYRSYLRYVRGMYGSWIYIPTQEDTTKVFNEYQEDARRRRNEGRLLPGEFFEEVGGITEIRGQMAVMAINGALSKLMFEKNPEREFYVEESFPLNWMYPHLSPHGLILKINRQTHSELSGDLVQRDHEYWTHYIGPMIGDWLNYDTSLPEVVAYVERVYLRHELSGFAGDPAYVQNEIPQKSFYKLRSSIGGLYAWRAQNSNSPAEKERMLKEADFALRQALALCPVSPEAVFRYVNLMLGQKRLDDAILVAQAAVNLEEHGAPRQETPAHIQEDFSHKPMIESQTTPPKLLTQLGSLLEHLKRMKST
jgi:hypothetical protein